MARLFGWNTVFKNQISLCQQIFYYTLLHIGCLLDFHMTYNNFIWCYIKCSSFWPSDNIKPMSNNLLHAMAWQCLFALSMCVLIGLVKDNHSILFWCNFSEGEKVWHLVGENDCLPCLMLMDDTNIESYNAEKRKALPVEVHLFEACAGTKLSSATIDV
jgi:hypothetical protein